MHFKHSTVRPFDFCTLNYRLKTSLCCWPRFPQPLRVSCPETGLLVALEHFQHGNFSFRGNILERVQCLLVNATSKLPDRRSTRDGEPSLSSCSIQVRSRTRIGRDEKREMSSEQRLDWAGSICVSPLLHKQRQLVHSQLRNMKRPALCTFSIQESNVAKQQTIEVVKQWKRRAGS